MQDLTVQIPKRHSHHVCMKYGHEQYLSFRSANSCWIFFMWSMRSNRFSSASSSAGRGGTTFGCQFAFAGHCAQKERMTRFPCTAKENCESI